MAIFSELCVRRAFIGGILGICGIFFSGYIVLDTTIYTGTLLPRFNKSMIFQDNRDKKPYDVIILTYMRSGSSFIGKLVGHRDDTFYWYEPLWKTHKWQFHSKGQMICDYRKDGCKNVNGSASSIQNTLNFLLDIYKCNLKDHFDRFSRDLAGNPRFGGATSLVFQQCRHQNCTKCVQVEPKNCSNCTTKTKCQKTKCLQSQIKECYEKWIPHCKGAKNRATKVLRLDTSHAKYLLENHKRLKLVQIFRDPRAVLNSRKETDWYYKNKTSPAIDVKVLCKRMESDISSAERLRTLFPDRVKIIQYEDFYDPNRTARILYDFLNMEMTDYVKTSILAPLYKRDKNNSGGFHPDSYRYKLDPKIILVSNKYCQKVFQRLGLRPLNSISEIKNKGLSIILDKVHYPLR